MPIITIKYFQPADTTIVAPMLENVQNSSAEALDCAVDNVWVIFQVISPEYYIHTSRQTNQSHQTNLSHEKTHPPIVIIKAQAGRSKAQRDKLVANVSAFVGQGLSISPKNVWIYYQEMKPQDVWFGGHWAG